MESTPRSGSPALRQGLIFGIILAVVDIAFAYLGGFLGSVLLVEIVGLAIFLFIGFLAGRRASTQTGRIGTGVLAGFIAGLIGTFIYSILPAVITLTNMNTAINNLKQLAKQQGLPQNTVTSTLVIQNLILGVIFNLVLASLLTLAGGAIGGYFGRGRAQVPQQQEYQESMFVPPSTTPTPTPTPTPAPMPPEDESPQT